MLPTRAANRVSLINHLSTETGFFISKNTGLIELSTIRSGACGLGFVMEKKEGILVFNQFEGKFAIAEDDQSLPFDTIEFGDTFEVKYHDEWIKTNIEISSDDNGQLVFKLKGIDYKGDISGFDARK